MEAWQIMSFKDSLIFEAGFNKAKSEYERLLCTKRWTIHRQNAELVVLRKRVHEQRQHLACFMGKSAPDLREYVGP